MKHIDRILGVALGLIAFVVYLATLSIGAYPGESASLVAQYTGLFPLFTPSHPLWHGLVWLVSGIPAGSAAGRLNVLSALCGAISVGLLYLVMSRAVLALVQVSQANRVRVGIAARLAGSVSAVFFAFCVPFWMVSTRAHPASFDILLLLAEAWLFLIYATTSREKFGLIFAFIYGLGVVEFATFIVLAPLFGLYILILLWRREDLRPAPILRLAACGVAGLTLYLLAAWQFAGTAGYHARGYENYWQILWFSWLDQYYLITRSLPALGWLTLLIVAVVPWLVSLMVAGRALNEERDWTYYLLHAVMTALALFVLLNLQIVKAPMLGSGKVLVTPCLLAASLFGYLAAYWFLFPATLWPDTEEPDMPVKLRLRNGFGAVVAAAAVILVCWAPFRNFADADGRPAGLVNRHAREIINSMAGREWLVTDGMLDYNLMIAAKEMGRPSLKLLDLSSGEKEVYMRHIAGWFDRPRLRNLARVGMMPLLQEWFRSDPEIGKKAALLVEADLWIEAGCTAVPHGLVFLGIGKNEKADVPELLAAQKDIWEKLVPLAKKEMARTPQIPFILRNIIRHAGLMANNMGVFLEDMGLKQEAFDCYSKAREIEPRNISALLNLYAMTQGGFAAAEAGALKKDLDDLLANMKEKYELWSLTRLYGYVRSPEAFDRMGWMWAISGKARLAESGLRKAMDLLPDEKKGGVMQRLANVYLAQNQNAQSEALYAQLLKTDPNNKGALLGMARIATRKGDFEKAKELIGKAEKAGIPATVAAVELAQVSVSEGKTDEARARLEETVKNAPGMSKAWSMLVGIAVQKMDQKALADYVNRMQEVKGPLQNVINVAGGHLALMQNDWDGARKNFDTVLSAMPRDVQVREWILRLDVIQGRRDDAGKHGRTLLVLDPDNWLANYVVGTLQMANKERELAEDSFRKSLEARRTSWACNDLAWLLQEKGGYEEAEKLVREALRTDDKMPLMLDTLGVILMKTKRLDEAEKTLEQALKISQADTATYLHMAELQAAKGNREKTRELLSMLSEKRERLSLDDQKKLERLKEGLGRK